MKIILITLVAVVEGTMVACSSAPAAPVAPPPAAYSDAEVIGAVKGFLNGPGAQSSSEHLTAEEHYV